MANKSILISNGTDNLYPLPLPNPVNKAKRLYSDVSMNDITEVGCYEASGYNVPTELPPDITNCVIFVMLGRNGADVYQILVTSIGVRIFIRASYATSGQTWTDWKEINMTVVP